MTKHKADPTGLGHLVDLHSPHEDIQIAEESGDASGDDGATISTAHSRYGDILVAKVGVQVEWSGLSGTISSVGQDHVLLAIPDGAILTVAFGEKVRYDGHNLILGLSVEPPRSQ